MSDEKKDNLISVFVDGIEVKVPPGTNMVEAATMVNKEVPHYCYHPKLSVVGNCRMCLVEMGMPGRDRATGQPILDENGVQKIMWMPRPAIACATNASPGLHIKTDSEMVKNCREGVMEFLLVNHPLDCPICDQAGECRLQEFATDYGRGYSRYVERKNVKPKRTKIGPRVMLDDERCILCSRCIRFSKEIAKDDVLGFIDRGSFSTLTTFPGKELANNYSLNTVDICPVGALTSLDFRFKMRVWFLKESKSICTESSAGVNTEVGSREGKLYRITPRRNDEVNDTWMSDTGRMLYKTVEAENRLRQYTLSGRQTTAEGALVEAADILKKGKVAIVGSGRSSVEEQYLLKKLAAQLNAVRVDLVSRTQEGDDLLISKDANPNVRGALVTGLISELPQAELVDLAKAIEAGEVDTVVSAGEDLTEAGISSELLAKVKVIYLGSHGNRTSEKAAVSMPGLSVFEKSGTFINQQFRVQRFFQAVPGPVGVFNDVLMLGRLLALLTDSKPEAMSASSVWQQMSTEISELSGLSFEKISDLGVVINFEKWKGLPFVETEILHYSPSDYGAVAVEA